MWRLFACNPRLATTIIRFMFRAIAFLLIAAGGLQGQNTEPSKAHAQALCTVLFESSPQRSSRVNNEAKACLDEVFLNARNHPDAMIFIVGNSAAGELNGTRLAAQRAVNVRDYLVSEKGLEESSVQVRSGASQERTARTFLVPREAEFDLDVPGAKPVDQRLVKPH